MTAPVQHSVSPRIPRQRHPVRVVVVDDHQVVRVGIRQLLAASPAVHLVGEAEDVAGALRVVEMVRPDVVLLDVWLGSESGLDACPQIVRRSPGTKVVLFAGDDTVTVAEALQIGARGYLPKGVRRDALLRAIHDVCSGKTVFVVASDDVSDGYATKAPRAGNWPGARNGLSRRESEVLQLMTQGLDNRGIARVLYIGEETVKTHVKAVLRKLKARDRTHGVVIALRQGMVR